MQYTLVRNRSLLTTTSRHQLLIQVQERSMQPPISQAQIHLGHTLVHIHPCSHTSINTLHHPSLRSAQPSLVDTTQYHMIDWSKLTFFNVCRWITTNSSSPCWTILYTCSIRLMSISGLDSSIMTGSTVAICMRSWVWYCMLPSLCSWVQLGFLTWKYHCSPSETPEVSTPNKVIQRPVDFGFSTRWFPIQKPIKKYDNNIPAEYVAWGYLGGPFHRYSSREWHFCRHSYIVVQPAALWWSSADDSMERNTTALLGDPHWHITMCTGWELLCRMNWLTGIWVSLSMWPAI